MTLVVCWPHNNGHLWCGADTRVSSGEIAISDTGAKIFVIPVRYRSGGDNAELSHFTLGFAFCGATLPAQNTHAIASTLSQMMRSDDPEAIPSAKGIATVYAKVSEYVLRDLRSRQPEDELFHAIVFGYCRAEQRFKIFELQPKINRDGFIMDLVDVLAMGSGSKEFDRQLDIKSSIGQNRSVLEVSRQVITGGVVPSASVGTRK